MCFLDYLIKINILSKACIIVRREKNKILQYYLFHDFTHLGIQLKWEENKYQIKYVFVGHMHLERQRKNGTALIHGSHFLKIKKNKKQMHETKKWNLKFNT